MSWLAIIEGYANVAELVDALDLGSSAVRRGGSSPFIRTRLFSTLCGEQIATECLETRQHVLFVRKL